MAPGASLLNHGEFPHKGAAHASGRGRVSPLVPDPAILVVIVAALVGMFFAACGVALRRMSRKRLANRLEAKGKADCLDPFVDKIQSIILMTGMFRACCTMLVVLAVFHTLETMATFLDRTQIYLGVVLISGVIICVFIVALPASLGRYSREKLVVFAMPILNLITSGRWPGSPKA